MKLGGYAHISLSVVEIQRSFQFYQKLGFTKIWEHPEPHPWMLLTDGVLNIHLYECTIPTPSVNYFASDMPRRVHLLRSLGIDVEHQQNKDGSLQQDSFYDPNELCIALSHHSHDEMPKPTGNSTSRCGGFGELSIPTDNLEGSVRFWEKLGFLLTERGISPYPWASLSDDVLTLGFHQTSELSDFALTYVSPTMIDIIRQLKSEEVRFDHEFKNRNGDTVTAVLRSPDGQALILLTVGPP